MQQAKCALSSKGDFDLGYQPLDLDCSDLELDRILAKEDEPYCAMCSSERRQFKDSDADPEPYGPPRLNE